MPACRAGRSTTIAASRRPPPEAGGACSALEGLRRRTGTFVALSGEPGIGKTRLFDELAAAAEEQECLVLKGRGADLEREMPFGVWVDALDNHVAWLGPDRLRRMVGEQVGELARVLPSAMVEQRATAEVVLPDERYRAHWAVRALLERIAGVRPLVVLLDDIHWTDGASLELVMHLLRRPLPAPVLIGLAFRSGRLSPSMLGALEAALVTGMSSMCGWDRSRPATSTRCSAIGSPRRFVTICTTRAAAIRSACCSSRSGGLPPARRRAGPGPSPECRRRSRPRSARRSMR